MTGLYTVLDFESTSVGNNARATEIGLVALNGSLDAHDVFESVINPPMRPDKTSLTHSRLSLDQLAAAPTFSEVWPHAVALLDRRILVVHNKDFDLPILQRELNAADFPVYDFPVVCTLEWARKILKHRLSGYKLDQVCAYFDVPLINAHAAQVDANATALVFKELFSMSTELQEYCESLAEKVVRVEKPKHKGTKALKRRQYTAIDLLPVELEAMVQEIRANSKIKMIVMTGKVMMGGSAFAELVEKAGYEFRESPTTAGTAFVVQGYDGGQSKIDKAFKYKRPVLTEADAITVLNMLIEMKR
jgi:DNA polymerase III epsilon subunit-like protein